MGRVMVCLKNTAAHNYVELQFVFVVGIRDLVGLASAYTVTG